jgi:CheY-like chemotaxis protein
VFLDIAMRIMDGYEVARRVRALFPQTVNGK